MPQGIPSGEADKAIRERNRLLARYRAARRDHRRRLYQQPDGEKLHAMALQIGRYGIYDAAAFLAYVKEQARGWLATAEPEMRHEALAIVSERIQRVRVTAGLPPFDDALPGEDEDLWQACKQELGA
jgi:hypothetical protein